MRGAGAPTGLREGVVRGPGDAELAVAVGWASEGIDALHLRRRRHRHHRTTERCLVALGQGEARVERETVRLEAGDPLVEAGAAHDVPANPPASFCVVVDISGLPRVDARADSEPAPRVWLGR